MQKQINLLVCIFFVVLLCVIQANFAFAVEVKLTVENTSQVDREGDVVTTGVPFAKGAIKDVSKLAIKVDDKAIPAQFVNIVPWDDGSVRWALLDTQVDVPAGKSIELLLKNKGKKPKPKNPVKVEENDNGLQVSTGPLEFVVNKTKFNIFESLKIDGKELITQKGKGLVIYKANGEEVLAGPPGAITIEHQGPMRTTICIKGKFPNVHNNLLSYTVRVTAYAGKKFVKMQIWFENDGGMTVRSPGDAKWFGFDGFSAEFGLNLGDNIQSECEDAKVSGNFKVEQRNPSHNWKGFAYEITQGDKKIKIGARTDGNVKISGDNGTLTTGIRHFWENYEKTIELENNTLKLWLWPRDGEWPRSKVSRGHDDKKEFRQYRKPGLYFLSGGVHKGHEIILDFSDRKIANISATLRKPLMALASPEYIASTEATPGWMAPANFIEGSDNYVKATNVWNKLADNAIAPIGTKGSLYTARQGGADHRGFWHGWMDFGDNLWDGGYSSLHYDWTWIMLQNYLRTGKQEFLDIGTTMAKHRIDIDQIWTNKDSQYYSNLTRYEMCFTSIHGGLKEGYYGPITSHTWLSGVVLYYMLTGDMKAKECAINCGKGLSRRQVSRYRNKARAGGQTRESGWAILGFCSLYDMTSDKKYLDEAMVLFNNHIMKQWQARGPYLESNLQYYYSTQGLCELHDRTNDPNILKLLKEGCDGQFPKKSYAEWRVFLSNIHAYVGYKTKDEKYIKSAEDLFSIYTNSKSYLKCYAETGAWDKESGKLLRNGHILQFVKWKMKKDKENRE